MTRPACVRQVAGGIVGLATRPTTRRGSLRAKWRSVTLAPPPACLSCGSCCFSLLECYVAVTGADHGRLAEQADSLTHFEGNRCYMNMFEGHCAALVLDAANSHFVCSVYELRPATCRDLESGSGACRGEIHAKGERPEALLQLHRSHAAR